MDDNSSSNSNSSNKLYSSYESALADVINSSASLTILIGGFGDCGVPADLVTTLAKSRLNCTSSSTAQHTIVSATGGTGQHSAIGQLVVSGATQKLVSTYIGADPTIYRQHLAGRLELELITQGVLAERLHAGSTGVGAFYTRAGVGTSSQLGGVPLKYSANGDGTVLSATQPKESRWLDGAEHVLELALRADVALVRAWKADTAGNLLMRRSANNFNSVMAAAAALTIVEVDEVVEAGQLDPDCVHAPGLRVQRVVLRKPQSGRSLVKRQVSATRRKLLEPGIQRIIRRAALELPNNAAVNLGLGIPTLIANCAPPGALLHSENGIVGVGPPPSCDEEVDDDVINASRDCVTLRAGAVCLDSCSSFGLVSSGELHSTILGASQVSEQGDIANWVQPGVAAVGMGGAMDLVSRPETTAVIVAMRHCDSAGRPKIVQHCTLPLTGRRCVSRIITELAVFDVQLGNNGVGENNGGLVLTELSDGVSINDVVSRTGCKFTISPKLSRMRQIVN